MGVSTRAAAFTALRCGLRPHCVDYFADRDLAAVCPAERVEAGSALPGFLGAAEALPPSPWSYTGALENHPDLVERISRRHSLWGIGGEALRGVRDPIAVARVLNGAGIPAPEVRLDPSGLPRDGSWLVKPRASGGGLGIGPLKAPSGTSSSPVYFQRRVDGPSFSALFIGRAGSARWIGVTRQWIGIPGRPFAYRGSIGPCPIVSGLAERLEALGNRLAAAFGLVGWFGVDYVLQDGIPWPVEVNPRYPASLEIHELASGRSLMEEHRRACEGDAGSAPAWVVPASGPSRWIARRVIYAPRRLVMPEGVGPGGLGDLFAVPTIADVPGPGTIVEAGEPVMTVFAGGADAAICHARLVRRERYWAQRLGFVP
jgi:predicted ATP-grasp superfamily ATP-dependent carboligase